MYWYVYKYRNQIGKVFNELRAKFNSVCRYGHTLLNLARNFS